MLMSEAALSFPGGTKEDALSVPSVVCLTPVPADYGQR